MAFFVLSYTDVSLFFSNVNRFNFLYYCVVCLCIISIDNFAIDKNIVLFLSDLPVITCFLTCKGMAGLSDTKHHISVICRESFQAAFHNQRLGIPEKILYRLLGVLTS